MSFKDKDVNDLCTLVNKLYESVRTTENKFAYSKLNQLELNENIVRSRKVFGLMMQAFFRKNDDNKFQPCQGELDFLKGMVEAVHLCYDLRRRASLRDFYLILLPGEFPYNFDSGEINQYTIDIPFLKWNTGIEFLNRNDTIFHIHQSNEKDRKEFGDLDNRAKKIALEIKRLSLEKSVRIKQYPRTFKRDTLDVHILDGHGRMLVLLMRALELIEINLDLIKFKVFEIDEVVHEYHKYVFSEQIEKVKGCIINQSPIPENAMIYLNFCSINSTGKFGWTAHFKEQNIKDHEWACVKENVLRFIAKSTGHPYKCTVMVSFVVKHEPNKPFMYQVEFKKNLGDHLTGLGLLYVLLNDFKAEIVSIRPEYEIEFLDRCKLIPMKLHSGGKGCPFVSLLVKPGDYHGDLKERFTVGCPFYHSPRGCNCDHDEVSGVDLVERKAGKIADLKEDTIQKGVRVQIFSGVNEGREGIVISRTAAKASIEVGYGRKPLNPYIHQIEALRTRKWGREYLQTRDEDIQVRHGYVHNDQQ